MLAFFALLLSYGAFAQDGFGGAIIVVANNTRDYSKLPRDRIHSFRTVYQGGQTIPLEQLSTRLDPHRPFCFVDEVYSPPLNANPSDEAVQARMTFYTGRQSYVGPVSDESHDSVTTRSPFLDHFAIPPYVDMPGQIETDPPLRYQVRSFESGTSLTEGPGWRAILYCTGNSSPNRASSTVASTADIRTALGSAFNVLGVSDDVARTWLGSHSTPAQVLQTMHINAAAPLEVVRPRETSASPPTAVRGQPPLSLVSNRVRDFRGLRGRALGPGHQSTYTFRTVYQGGRKINLDQLGSELRLDRPFCVLDEVFSPNLGAVNYEGIGRPVFDSSASAEWMSVTDEPLAGQFYAPPRAALGSFKTPLKFPYVWRRFTYNHIGGNGEGYRTSLLCAGTNDPRTPHGARAATNDEIKQALGTDFSPIPDSDVRGVKDLVERLTFLDHIFMESARVQNRRWDPATQQETFDSEGLEAAERDRAVQAQTVRKKLQELKINTEVPVEVVQPVN